MLQPKLRFKGFEKEWEEEKLGKISDVSKLAGFEFTDYVTYEETGKIIALRGLNIKNNKLDLNDVKYIDKSNFSKLERSRLYKDDLMFTYVGTIGEVALIPENDKYYLAPNVCRIRVIPKINARYLLFIFNSPSIKNEIYKYLTITSQPALSMENIRKFSIKVPILKEQKKIADFLSSVDVKINLTENKLELLKEYKKGIMQKIFSQELRFKDSNGNAYPKWEEKKFNEVFSFLQNNTFSRECLTTEKQEVQNIHYGDILTKYNNILKITNDIPYIKKEYNLSKFSEESFLKTGDIIIADTAEDFTVGKAIEISNTKKKKVLSGLHTFACRTNFNFAFGYLGQYLNSNQYHLQLYFFVTGIKVSSISKHSIKDTKLFFPKNEKEQKKIADFLSSIDTKIEKLSDELENLKEFKKGLLQQMFV